MRRFWARWGSNFLSRRADGRVHFVTSSNSTSGWNEYVASLARALEEVGRDAQIHLSSATAGSPDESLIEQLRGSSGVVIACDESVAETVWLATVNGGTAVYLMPSMESVAHPGDSAAQARIVAGYRPDFDYIAPNRWTQRQLAAETAWEARYRISPALHPGPLPPSSDAAIVSVAADGVHRAIIDQIAKRTGLDARHLDGRPAQSLIDELRAINPRVVADFSDHQNSLIPFGLMSLGGVYVAPVTPQLSHDVLDGYNALLFAPGDTEGLTRALDDASTRDEVWSELRANGRESARRAAVIARDEFVRAVASFGESPV